MAVMEGGRRGPGHSGGLWRLGAQNSCLQHGLDEWRANTPCIIQQICSQSFPSLLNPTQVLI